MAVSKRFLSPNPFTVGLITVCLAILVYLIKPSFLELMELWTLDLRFKVRGATQPGSEVVLAVIDEKSLNELGRWPWPRTIIADFLEKLNGYEARVIGFDSVFAESDQHSRLMTVQSIQDRVEALGLKSPTLATYLEEVGNEADTDGRLAEAIRNAGSAVLGYFFHTETGALESQTSANEDAAFENISLFHYPLQQFRTQQTKAPFGEATGIEANLPGLTAAATGCGYFNVFPDDDGTVRRIPLVFKYKDHYFPPLSLQVLKEYLQAPDMLLRIDELGVAHIQLGDIRIPTDEQGRMLINYRGGPKTFPHLSFTDIINGRLPKESIKDKIVLFGATAIGIYDIRNTPFASIFPGLEIHANIVDNILKQDFLVRPTLAGAIDILVIIIIGVILALVLPRLKALWAIGFTLLAVSSYVFLNLYLFEEMRIWINLVYPSTTGILTYTGITVFRYMTEEREKRKVRGAFERYVDSSVVEEVLKAPDKLKLGGEEKELTALFTDIRGFTTISEQLSPEAIARLLNEYLTAMTNIVMEHGGTLDKFMGDAVMAFYGAPIDQPDHPVRACRTALDMMSRLKALQQKWEKDGLPHLDIGIGINTGKMVVGNMGSDTLFDYTVIGDNVNLASRLEGLNKQYGTNIIVSEFTHPHIHDTCTLRELDLVQVKGKAKAVRIFEVVGEDGLTPDWKKLFLTPFESGLSAYRAKEWDRAIELFNEALKALPQDAASKLYITRCEDYKAHPPPPDWDGVYTALTK
jgi:adenylate cyclase